MCYIVNNLCACQITDCSVIYFSDESPTLATPQRDSRVPEILDAALACFAQKGFAAARMDDIAARAGITKGTIYLYFDSKESVFKALAREEVGTRLAGMTQLVEGFEGHSADLLRLVLTTMGTLVRTSDGVILPKLLLAEAGNFPELAEFWRREIIDRGLGLFERIIARGQGRGEFRDMAPGHAAPAVRCADAHHRVLAHRVRQVA